MDLKVRVDVNFARIDVNFQMVNVTDFLARLDEVQEELLKYPQRRRWRRS